MHAEPLFAPQNLEDSKGSITASQTLESKAKPTSLQKFVLDPGMAEGEVIAKVLKESDFSCKKTEEELNCAVRLDGN